MPATPPKRRQQDRVSVRRPLYERAVLSVLALAGLGAALAGTWWLWQQSGAGAVVRDGSPNWSPDGQRVIFASEIDGRTDLHEANRSGGNRRQVTHTAADEGGAAYSPDGQWIAFHSDRDGNFEIYLVRADDTATRRLTNDPAVDQAPAWSRDGRHLVFMSNRGRTDAAFDVYRMTVDGADVERLTSGGANSFPQYSPDGGQLALQIGRDVHIMSLSTRGLRRLTHEPSDGMHPSWSPDGLRMAFTSSRNGRGEIFTARADGTDPEVVVTMPNGDAVDPRWSPDGRFIAFVHVPAGGLTPAQQSSQQRIVYVVELSTGRLSRISR